MDASKLTRSSEKFFMLHIIYIMILAFLGCSTESQLNSVDFKTFIFNLDNYQDSINFSHWKKKYLQNYEYNIDKKNTDFLYSKDGKIKGSLLYEDSKFLVYGYCWGEFGGALMFQDKIYKDSIYYLDSTCPIMIEKRNDGYYITETLAHDSGLGKIRFFKSPKELVNVHADSLETEWKFKKFPNLTEDSIFRLLNNQGTILIDTFGLTFSILFGFKNSDYLIFSDRNNTYIGLLTSKGLRTIDTIINIPTWSYDTNINDKINGYYHYNFHQTRDKGISIGDIYVKGDSIVIAFSHQNND